MQITKESLTNSTVFISIFISLFESLKDYIIECPKQLLGKNNTLRECNVMDIKKVEEEHLNEKKEAKEYLKNCDKALLNKKHLDKLECIANYNHIKVKKMDMLNG